VTDAAMERGVVLGRGHAPLAWSVGFVRAPYDRVLAATLEWRRGLVPGVDVSDLPTSFPDALLALAPLQTPPTREVLARTVDDQWTANLYNSHLGGDSCSWYMSRVLGCDAVVATHIPVGQYLYPVTSLTITSPRAAPPLNQLRYIGAGKYSSKWEFHESGERQAYEELERYKAKRIRDRFDREMLLRYLDALGIHADAPDFWVGGALLQHRVTFTSRTTPLDDIRRQYGIR
jgi:hypothetical protein